LLTGIYLKEYSMISGRNLKENTLNIILNNITTLFKKCSDVEMSLMAIASIFVCIVVVTEGGFHSVASVVFACLVSSNMLIILSVR